MHVNNINVKKLKKYNDISQENRDKALGELRLRISSLYKSYKSNLFHINNFGK